MQQKINILFILVSLLMVSCGGNEVNEADKIETREDQTIVTPDPVENLKANALKHDDLLGQAKWSLGVMQTGFTASKEQVDAIGDVTVSLDKDFVLSIRNKVDGDVNEQRVELKNLSDDLKSYEWIVDNDKNPHPGVKIPVLEGQSGVAIFVDGSSKGTKDYLEIIHVERALVQSSVGGLINAIRAARGEALRGE